MSILIAILSCHQYGDRRQAQRETWLTRLFGADYRFFLGTPPEGAGPALADEEFLDCPDDYASLCRKTQAVMRWSDFHEYQHTFKCDDDTFLVPGRLLRSGFEQYRYSGFCEPGWEVHEYFRYARGGSGYWLKRSAAAIIAAHMMLERKHCEDVAVGQTLQRHGIEAFHDNRYCHEEERVHRDAVIVDPSFISLHKCDPQQMREIHTTLTSY